MKLSIWSSYFMDLSPEEMVCEFENRGISYSELSDEHAAVLLKRGNPREVGKKFKEFAHRHHVQFPQGHLWLQCRLCQKDKTFVVETLKAWLDLFFEIGIRSAVLHCDGLSFSPETALEVIYKANISVLKELTDYIKDTDMIICLENLIEVPNQVDELLKIVKAVGGDNMGICLDTGHLNLTAKNHEEFIQKAGSWLKALHIDDNEGSTDQHLMPFGKGNVDFVKVVRALKGIHYQGVFNLEIPGERYCPIEIRRYKIDYIKKVYQYLMDAAETVV